MSTPRTPQLSLLSQYQNPRSLVSVNRVGDSYGFRGGLYLDLVEISVVGSSLSDSYDEPTEHIAYFTDKLTFDMHSKSTIATIYNDIHLRRDKLSSCSNLVQVRHSSLAWCVNSDHRTWSGGSKVKREDNSVNSVTDEGQQVEYVASLRNNHIIVPLQNSSSPIYPIVPSTLADGTPCISTVTDHLNSRDKSTDGDVDCMVIRERFVSSSYHVRPSLLCHGYIQTASPTDAKIQIIHRRDKSHPSPLFAILTSARSHSFGTVPRNAIKQPMPNKIAAEPVSRYLPHIKSHHSASGIIPKISLPG
ncbi:LOW QUALITY PROTEIN: hypothetical protein FGSG_11923 [Fusarium graminearum PH-1]|uniref:hypothetical protein n=1 Tax=Gibberella zeae (strain ATCC MYA-4620 / CBS 123657 / FGSC 9075 / NRRL 31084 / PH-1) TaxID=229533 RepID=UPI00021F1DBC|nr:LOW QUALITY PROTEIN: hypothetical protein FGSG_11923 [Fusarium graminearum PH-1]ESU06569.1 LOW QUALITY PROTEIN: hypothetical protein FGSG_11923 [Fusarium graminearum PH-1]|eukprot:XP_011317054.1 LOW QUALITY PROTEIN: hypothetical protein FGSG_11923 [Fusarium graminearum PH-1]